MAVQPKPFSAFETMIAWRYLRAKRAEGGVSVMTWISLIGITLAVFALIATLAVRAGYPYGEMQALFGGLTFVVYVPAFVWSYVSANQKLVWLVLAGGGTLMLLLAWWLQPA